MSEDKRPKSEMAALIDKLFKSIEKKMQASEHGGVVDEALKSSIFG